MPDSYEVTMMYRVVLPEGTEAKIEEVFWNDDPHAVMTELISEVQNRHVAEIESHTGTSKQDWVYLGAHTFWSRGWHNAQSLPLELGKLSISELQSLTEETFSGAPLMVLTGVECNMINWVWEGE